MVGTFIEARNLALRFRDGETFRHYVERRMHLVLPLVLLAFGAAMACAVGVFAFLVARASWLALPAIVLAPVALIGAFLAQAYLLFAWLENRSLARAHPHMAPPTINLVTRYLARYRINLGKLPAAPWLAIGVLYGVPLLALFATSPKTALLVVLLTIAAPLAFARLDR